MMRIDAEKVSALHLDAAARAASEAEIAHLSTTIQRLHAELTTARATLDAASITTHVLAGVPLRVEDTTASGGSWISVHPVVSVGKTRYAEVWKNCHTGAWMLNIAGAGTRSGGEIIATDADAAPLVSRACEWVASATR